MSSITTNLNISPYYSDFDPKSNYMRVLFRPSVPLQARELTNLQSMLQNQVSNMGDNLFVEGTIISGCPFNFDANYNYVKLPDLRVDGQPTQVSQYVGLIAYDASSNLQALVVNSYDGFESQNPDMKTLYLKYLNSGTSSLSAYTPLTTLTFYSNTVNSSNYQTSLDVKVANTLSSLGVAQNPVGKGYAFVVGEGTIYQKGHFVYVANNLTAIVSKYTNTPNNISVGFTTVESVVTELSDTSLLDNASGYSNYTAPGAHRLKLTPTLTVSNTYGVFTNNSGTYVNTAVSGLPSNNFLSIASWQNGQIVRTNQETQYNAIGNEMARREYESAGNYVVKQFALGAEPNPQSKDYYNVIVGAGLGYVGGFRVEQLAPARFLGRKGNDVKNLYSQSVVTGFGNYVRVQDMAGTIPPGNTVTLYSANSQGITKGANTSGGYTTTPSGTAIGTAVAIGIQYEGGNIDTNTAVYDVYLTNITMNSGYSFANVKSLAASNGTANTGIADLIPEFNATLAANVATLKNPNYSPLLFSLVGGGARTLVPTSVNTSFVYRSANTITFTAGIGSKNLPGTSVFAYGNGALNVLQQQSVIVVPQTTANVGNSTTFAGTVATTAGQANITGTSTKFTTQYQVNDYMYIGNTVNRVISIANDTFAVAAQTVPYTFVANTHNKTYPAGIPINFPNRYSNVVITSSNTMTITLISANGTTENTAFTASIVYDVLAPANSATVKTVNQNVYVAIDTAKNANLIGTVTSTATSNQITGVGTYFTNTLLPGYTLYTGNTTNPVLLGTISTINSNTSANLTSNATSAITTNTVLYSSVNPIGNTGPWSLGFPDAYNLKTVFKGSQNTAWATINTSIYDVTSEFMLNTNQTDSTYNISTLAKQPGSYLTVTNGDKLICIFDTFTIANPNTTNYYTVDSYKIDDANTANTTAIQTVNLPWYKNSTGVTVPLKNAVDFRVYVGNTISISSSLATATGNTKINPSGNNVLPTGATWVSPVNKFTYDISYYLGRMDKVTVNPYGQFNIIEGTPSENPQPPGEQDSAMTIGTIAIPPYPSLLPSQTANTRYPLPSIVYSAAQPRRYTMKDIGTLATRIQNLEYYTSLSLLEVQTKNLTIKNTATGLDRFKNGIFVDAFKDASGANINDPEYNIGNDMQEGSLVPVFHQFNLPLKYDYTRNGAANTTAHTHTGDLVSLPFTNTPYLTQNNATRVRNASAGFYDWIGKATVSPAYDNYIDNRIPGVTTICIPYICTPATTGPIPKSCTGPVVTKPPVSVVVPPIQCTLSSSTAGTPVCNIPTPVVPQPYVVPPFSYGGIGGGLNAGAANVTYPVIVQGGGGGGAWLPSINLNGPWTFSNIVCYPPIRNVSGDFGIQTQNADGTWGPTYDVQTVFGTTICTQAYTQDIVPGSCGINVCNICFVGLGNLSWCFTPAMSGCSFTGAGDVTSGLTCFGSIFGCFSSGFGCFGFSGFCFGGFGALGIGCFGAMGGL